MEILQPMENETFSNEIEGVSSLFNFHDDLFELHSKISKKIENEVSFFWVYVLRSLQICVIEGFNFLVHKMYFVTEIMTFFSLLTTFLRRTSSVVESELSKRRDCTYRRKHSQSG